MGFFSKIFGTKDDAKPAAKPQGAEYSIALSMHLRGETEPALNAYLKTMEELPDEVLAPFFAAAINAGRGRTAEAAASLRDLSRRISEAGDSMSRAISLELEAQVGSDPYLNLPAVAGIVESLGDALKVAGCVQEAAVCFEIAAAVVPDRANVLYKLGDTLHDLRVFDYAAAVLVEALKQAPNHWGALYTYAVLLQDLGRNEEALPYYEKAATLNPNHANCQNNYGAALLRTNRLEDALLHCSMAAKLDPASPSVQINLGNIHLLLQDFEKARASFSEAVSLDPDLAVAYFGLASAELALNSDPATVKGLYRKALEISPMFAEAYHALANVLAAEDDPDALHHFATAAQLNNSLKNVHKDFGHACLRLGRQEEALEHLKRALLQDPDDLMVQDLVARMVAA